MSRNEWKRPFETLKEKIKPLEETRLHLYHAIVMTPHHNREQAEASTRFLEPSLMGNDLIEIIETPTAGCQHHAHYFFGDHKAFDQLKSVFSDLHTWLSRTPTGLLPEFVLPRIKDNTSQNIVLWSNLIYALAWQAERWYLSADIEFQEGLGKLGFFLWEKLHSPPGIDPRTVLTHQKSLDCEFETWDKRFNEVSASVPEYIGAYLRDTGSEICGEYLRASLAAIDLLCLTSEAKSRTAKVFSPKPVTGRKKAKGKEEDAVKSVLKMRARVLLELLLEDHGCNSGNPVNQALSQSEMERRLVERRAPYSQPTISRAMDELMEQVPFMSKLEGMDKYEQLCGESRICDALSAIQVRSNRYLNRGLHEKHEFSDEFIEQHQDNRIDPL